MKRGMVLRAVFFAFAAVIVLLGNQQLLSQQSQEGRRSSLTVGVWTLWHDREIELAPAGLHRKFSLRTCAGCATLSFTRPANARADGDSVTLTAAGRTERAHSLVLTGATNLTAHGESITLQNPVTITARAGVLIIAINLPVESYVERVVASESSPADSDESLKALAIVVRSFALHEAHGHADFDLCDSTHCQLLHWGSNGPRRAAAHAATLATAGETLWFHGQRALAYFGKDCGGHTALPLEIWPRAQRLSYLTSHPDLYCSREGGKTWSSELSRADLTAALTARGLVRPGWKRLSVALRGESGRVVTVRLDAAEIPAEAFRLAVGQALGWNRIPSTWFEVSQQGDDFLFHGRGWGNGVGLCQKGAAAMAAQHRTTAQILDEYFPGAQTFDESTGQEWQTFPGDGFKLESLNGADAEFLSALVHALGDAAQRSGLSASTPIIVRAFSSTQAFRVDTLAPGWVAAFTEGQWIGTQPLRTLAARHLLDSTMRHEFMHVLIEHEAGPNAPLWLREGLVEAWSEVNKSAFAVSPTMHIDAVDVALSHSSSESDSASAHRAAGFYARRLIEHYGRAQVTNWLRSGIPSDVVAALGQR